MPLVRYDGPGHQLLAFGERVDRGDTAEFSDAEVTSLQAQPRLRITVLPPKPAPKAAAAAKPEARKGEGQTDPTDQED